MKKVLRFEIKPNLKRASRIYVKSPDLKTIYGSFHTNNPADFEGWIHLSPEQRAELTLFIENIQAVNELLGEGASNNLSDFRFRLPTDFIESIYALTALLEEENIPCNLYESAITGLIQQMKITTSKLTGGKKHIALNILDKIGLADYKKIDLTSQIQAVFSELLAIRNKSERLHEKALHLFDKDKSYSPKAIEGMAKGETLPSKWLVSCAIDILIDEKSTILKALLSDNDLFLLWAKPLLEHNTTITALLERSQFISKEGLDEKIYHYRQSIEKK
jgi:hypothetical protein